MKKSVLVLLVFGFLQAHAETLSLQGKILKPDGTALEASAVDFRVKILTPAEGCILYEEAQLAKNMTGSKGLFSIALNDGSGTRVDGNLWTLMGALSNKGTFSIDHTQCLTGSGTVSFTPTPGAERQVILYFKESTEPTWEAMPVTKLSHAGFAMDSAQVGGFPASSLCRVEDSGIPQTTAAFSSANFTELVALVNGSSTKYVTATSTAGVVIPSSTSTPTSAAEGSIWYDSTSHTLKYKDGSGVQSVGTSTGGSVTSVTAGTGITTTAGSSTAGGSITSTGTLYLTNTGVSASSYGSATQVPVISVDAQGRVTSAANTTISGVAPAGTASGDLAGTYPSPTIKAGAVTTSKMFTPVANQVRIVGVSGVAGETVSGLTCAANEVLKWDVTAGFICGADANAGGTITSVGISLPAIFNVTTPTVTGTGGTLTAGFNNQAQNAFFAGPASGGTGAPIFRALSSADLPTDRFYFEKNGDTVAKHFGWDSNAMIQLTNGYSSSTHYPGIQLYNYQGSSGTPSYGGYPVLELFNARGNVNAVLPVASGDTLGGIGFKGFYNSSGGSATGASISVVTSENWTASAMGTSMLFMTTKTGDTATAQRIAIASTGDVVIGAGVPQATLDIVGFTRLKKYAAQPTTCNSTTDGAIALTSQYMTCVCKGGTPAWVRTSDGTTACSW